MRSAEGTPIVAISNGDPAGIGPETIVKACATADIFAHAAPVVVGSPALFEAEISRLGASVELRILNRLEDASGRAGLLELLPFDTLDASKVTMGQLSSEAGRYSGASAEECIRLALVGSAHAAVVAPNNKRAMHEGGIVHTGFEEMCRHGTGAQRSIQILLGQRYRMARVTNHVPLSRVSELCTRARVLSAIETLAESLTMLGMPRPRIGVSGLNPHNGEHGIMGTEEMTDIEPACEDARARGLDVVGPIPADTAFLEIDKRSLDVLLSMYHDHGNSGMKILEFGQLVNFIGGLPVPVFTVSHGTAFDIAGKGIADETNMRLSIIAAGQSVRAN